MQKSIGAFTLIKNEAPWVGFCVMSAKELVSEWVYYDGGSTDGTIELLAYLKKKHGLNIKVFEGKDPVDLKDDYARLFDECLNRLTSDYAWFLHPDMIVTGGPFGLDLKGALAATVEMESFAGEPGGQILRFSEGRQRSWKSIMLRDFGLHYHGHYGAGDEDLYFRDITGESHDVHKDFSLYPYEIRESGITAFHFSDVRPFARRLSRMTVCLQNQHPGLSRHEAEAMATTHPRVSLRPHKDWPEFSFEPVANIPQIFHEYAHEFCAVLGKSPEDICWLPLKAGMNKEPLAVPG